MKIALLAVTLLLPISQAASISGRVVDAAGAAVVHAPVKLNSATTTQTDSSGVYEFANLPSGEYTLTFQAQGFKSITLESIVLSEREQKRIPELILDVADLADCGHYPPSFRLVSGDAYFGSLAGSAVADVDVTLVCRTFSPCGSTKTDSKGRFSFSMLSPGEYGLSFRRDGFYPELATGYAFRVKAGLESVYGPVPLERCPNGNCDPKTRPPAPVAVCE
ncbi:MAG TPA: carboxypeptidase-like regulatory domain-containing protein [Bryobacteraceae bacterium]